MPDDRSLSGQNGVRTGTSVKPDCASYCSGYPPGPRREREKWNATDHKLDHGVPDPKCDYCKTSSGTLIQTFGPEENPERSLFSPSISQDRIPQRCIQPIS